MPIRRLHPYQLAQTVLDLPNCFAKAKYSQIDAIKIYSVFFILADISSLLINIFVHVTSDNDVTDILF